MKDNNATLIKFLEELSLNSWPALSTRLYDGWILRFSNGYTKRSNSVNTIYESTINLNEKIKYCENQYKTQNLPCVFKITPESKPFNLDSELEDQGYKKVDETAIRIASLQESDLYEPEQVMIESGFSKEWLNNVNKLHGISSFEEVISNKIHEKISDDVICITKVLDGEIVGCGFGVVDRGYVGIYDIIVDEIHRGKGFGKDIVVGILRTAYKKNIKNAYLSVVAGNVPAENLYSKLGFSEVYHYWYRIKNID